MSRDLKEIRKCGSQLSDRKFIPVTRSSDLHSPKVYLMCLLNSKEISVTEVQRAELKVVEEGLFLIWKRLLSLPGGLCDKPTLQWDQRHSKGQTLGGVKCACFKNWIPFLT